MPDVTLQSAFGHVTQRTPASIEQLNPEYYVHVKNFHYDLEKIFAQNLSLWEDYVLVLVRSGVSGTEAVCGTLKAAKLMNSRQPWHHEGTKQRNTPPYAAYISNKGLQKTSLIS